MRIADDTASEDEVLDKANLRTEAAVDDEGVENMRGSDIFAKSSLGGGKGKKKVNKKPPNRKDKPKNDALIAAKKVLTWLRKKIDEGKNWDSKLQMAKVPQVP